MRISVVIPSYNQGEYLAETLDSVVGQNYGDLELLVADGGSTDHSADLIKSREADLAWWVSEADLGQSHAINKGLERATGDIVCWLNSDDLHCPDTLTTVAEYFRDHPDIQVLQGGVINFSEGGTSELVESHPVDAEEMIRRIPFHQPGVFWRREILETTGLLDESLFFCMDYDLWMRFFFNFRFGYLDRPLARFRVHDSAKTAGNPIELYLEYRKVVSRFFRSVSAAAVRTLDQLGLYDNAEDARYNLSLIPDAPTTERLLRIYVHECAVQEYTRGHGFRAGKLAIAGWNGAAFPANLSLALRAFSGMAHIRKWLIRS